MTSAELENFVRHDVENVGGALIRAYHVVMK